MQNNNSKIKTDFIEHKRFGYTLIEIVVVLAIIASITTLSTVSFREGNRLFSLDAAAEQIINDIERAKNNALSGKSANKIRGYGLRISLSSNAQYAIFADRESGTDTCKRTVDDVMTEVQLPAGIIIDDVIIEDPVNGDEYPGYIEPCFTVFNGEFFIKDPPAPAPVSAEISIVLKDMISGKIKIIKINPLGLVKPFESTCGNGILEVSEQCDDGNTVSNDYCSDRCVIEYCGDDTRQSIRPRTFEGDYYFSDPTWLEDCDGESTCTDTCRWIGCPPIIPPCGIQPVAGDMNNKNSLLFFAYFLSIPLIVWGIKILLKNQMIKNNHQP